MSESNSSSSSLNLHNMRKPVIELAIQLVALFALLSWCFDIVRPFIVLIIWALIVAVALYPVFNHLARALGDSKKLAATILSLILISLLVVPAVMLTDSLLTGAEMLSAAGDAGELQVPPPPASVSEWPLVGNAIHDLWQRAADNLPAVLKEFSPQVRALGAWILESATGTGLGILQFIAAFIIAGVLLANYEKSAGAVHKLLNRLVPDRGMEFANLSTSTIRNVALGIVGVSILQTTMLTIGFVVIDLPGTGLAALMVLVLCIVQIGPGLVAIPAIIYAFSVLGTGAAVVFTIWTVVMTMMDSVLKPLVFGRGAGVPTLVIFLGAIGGMLIYGIIGLFVGAVILSLGYKLYMAWLDDTPEAEGEEETAG
jgi:predicted PurR-regulated permease PerM